MEEYAACHKCGLKVVRYELERRGIVLRFCDTCYWGEVSPGQHPPGGEVGETAEQPHIRGSACGGSRNSSGDVLRRHGFSSKESGHTVSMM